MQVRPCERRAWRRGVAAVEFAIVTPVFLLFVFGLLELSRAVMVQQALTDASRLGCRKAMLATTISDSEVEVAVRHYLRSLTAYADDSTKVRLTTPTNLASCQSGTQLTVSAELDYRDVSWLPIDYLGVSPTIRAEQSTRRE